MSYGPADLATELFGGWKSRAACSGYPNSLFFPTTETSASRVERAVSICKVCPVTEECLEYAFETNQRAGIWGGTTEDERKSLRRKWLASRRRTA